MTDYPIPDELRDQFAAAWVYSWDLLTATPRQVRNRTKRYLDEHVKRGARIELRLPEFAVHDDTCCGGSGRVHLCGLPGLNVEHVAPCDHYKPCPGVGYYHWTARCPYCNGTHKRVLSDTMTDLLLSNGAKVDWSDIRTVA